MNKPTTSFEFFPAKTEKGGENLLKTAKELDALRPSYMTVTYGAGGSTRDNTLETALNIQKESACPIATHMTYINTPRKEIYALADHLWECGIKHIVALRGDLSDDLSWPLDKDEEYFQYTSHFVVALKARHDFEISVGAYPEKHPDASSLDADIEALMKKCDAGANRAITQFFFNNDSYYHFIDQVRAAGIETPIVPGILPIYDFQNMLKFAGNCQAHVPDWLHKKFEGLEDKPEESLKIAEELLITQCRDLMENGVEHFHFYTLNKAGLTLKTCQALGLN